MVCCKKVKKEQPSAVPKEVISLIRQAETMIARKEYAKGIKILIKVLSLDEDNVNASSQLAYAFLQTGEFKKAEGLFRKVLDKKPRDPAILTNYALSIFEQKNAIIISESNSNKIFGETKRDFFM